MHESELILVLKEALCHNILLSILFWIPCLSTCFVFLYEYRHNVKHNPKSKRMAGIVLAFIFAIVIPIVTCIKCIPICQDIAQNQISIATGCFSKHDGANTKSLILSNSSVYFTMDQGDMTLYVPLEYNYDIPLGSFYGKIWYGQSSNIILAFEVEMYAKEDP